MSETGNKGKSQHVPAEVKTSCLQTQGHSHRGSFAICAEEHRILASHGRQQPNSNAVFSNLLVLVGTPLPAYGMGKAELQNKPVPRYFDKGT